MSNKGKGSEGTASGAGAKRGVSNGDPSEFRKALTKLAGDPKYRAEVTREPQRLQQEFKLTLKDLQALRQVAIMSGADVTQVNRVRAEAIMGDVTGISVINVDVSCCSCCCCCCGETSVVPVAS